MFLARHSQKLYQEKYGKHLIFEQQTVISTAQKILFLLLGVGVGAVWGCLYVANPEVALSFFGGITVAWFAYLIGIHLARITVFRYVIQHPDAISGVTHFKRRLVNLIGYAITLPPTVLLLVIALFAGTPFIWGAAAMFTFISLLQFFMVITTPIF